MPACKDVAESSTDRRERWEVASDDGAVSPPRAYDLSRTRLSSAIRVPDFLVGQRRLQHVCVLAAHSKTGHQVADQPVHDGIGVAHHLGG